MGYYTTITIDNAVVGNIQNSPVEFTKKIIDACSGVYYKTGRDAFGLGIDVPFVFLQKPREFVESTVFVYREGRLHEMIPHSAITQEIAEHQPEKYSDLLTYLQETTDKLSPVNEKTVDSSDDFEFVKEDITESKELVTDTPFIFDTTKEIINSGEANVIMDDVESIVAKWLKDNKIPMTVAKLKKLKTKK